MLKLPSSAKTTSDTCSQASEGSTLSRQSAQRAYNLDSPTKARHAIENFLDQYKRARPLQNARIIEDKKQLERLEKYIRERARLYDLGVTKASNTGNRLIRVPVVPISAETTPHLPMFQGYNKLPQV